MILKEFHPLPAFREFVKWYRIVHFQFESPTIIPIKVYPPKPEVCLHYFLCDGEEIEEEREKFHSFRVVLTGQQTAVLKRHLCPDFLDFQIVFQPTAIFRLTGIPAYELTDRYLDAELVFSKHLIATTLDTLKNAKDYEELLAIGNHFMSALMRNSTKNILPLDAAVKMMLLYTGKVSLDYLAKESCLSSRQFERKHYERVGTHPKTYAKIIRFNMAYNLKNAFPDMDWLNIAITCGYYDYQHLSRDYREFTGYTPTNFHQLEGSSPEKMLNLTEGIYKSRSMGHLVTAD